MATTTNFDRAELDERYRLAAEPVPAFFGRSQDGEFFLGLAAWLPASIIIWGALIYLLLG